MPIFQPDLAWWESVFAAIDAAEVARFVDLLTPDACFRFGNSPAITGTRAIAESVTKFFSAISSCRHRVHRTWNGAESAVCEGDVTYTRLDGSSVNFPFANVFELRGEKVAAYRIYIDNSPLFGDARET